MNNDKSTKMEFTIQDVYEAYRKLKSYVYYDNTSLFLRKKLAKFEYDNFHKGEVQEITENELREILEQTFNPLVEFLNQYNDEDDTLKEYTKDIEYKLTPKTIKRNEYNFITNQPQLENLEVEKCNIFIDAPIKIHLISVLWLMYVGKHLNKDISENNYAYKLVLTDHSYITETGAMIEDRSRDPNEDGIVSGLQLYKPYFKDINNGEIMH